MTCLICSDRIHSRGLCNKHYKSERKAGRLQHVNRPYGLECLEDVFGWFMPGDPPLAPSPTEGCWDWQHRTDDDGYGIFAWGDGNMRAHRCSYLLFSGEIDADLLVRHTCDRPICVQPVHLVVGTNDDNMADMVERDRQVKGVAHHCARLTPEQVREIRNLVARGLSQHAVARQFGVVAQSVHSIVHRKSWAHVD